MLSCLGIVNLGGACPPAPHCLPPCARPLGLLRVGQEHLEVPWECLKDTKFRVYVKITYYEHF